MTEFIKRKTVKAKKEHQCGLCNGQIDIGELYDCATNIDGGKLYTFKSHFHCLKLVEVLKMDVPIFDDDFEDYVHDFVKDINIAALAKFAFNQIKEKELERRNEC